MVTTYAATEREAWDTRMRRSLEALILMGTASVLALGLGAVRMKLIAVNFGAIGIGSLGILVAAVTTLAAALGCGLGTAGVGALAGSAGLERWSAHRALSVGTWVLAPIAGAVAGAGWLPFSELVGFPGHADLAPALGLGVTATIFFARSSAELSAAGRVFHLAAVQVIGASLATAAIPVALLFSEQATLAAAVAGPPVALAVVGALAVRRYAKMCKLARSAPWWRALTSMLRLGLAVSTSTILLSASQLFATTWVTRTLGLENTGFFQASWSIANLYLTFLLSALTAEYLPRLSTLRQDRTALIRAADEQAQLLVVLATPIIAWLLVLAPLTMRALYADEFQAGAELLRLQLLGDVFKVFGWTLAYILLAREARARYFLGELTWNATFVGLVALLTNHGLVFVGLAYAVSYGLYLSVTIVQTAYRPSRQTIRVVAVGLGALAAVYGLTQAGLTDEPLGPILVSTAVTAWGLLTLRRIIRRHAIRQSPVGDARRI